MNEGSNAAEKVKQAQLGIANSMGISNKVLDELSNISDWRKREWIYLAALDQLDLEKFKENGEFVSAGEMKQRREILLKTKYSSENTEIKTTIEAIRKEVQLACGESVRIRDSVETMIKGSQRNDDLKNKEKDDLIEQLTHENVVLKHKLEESRKTIKSDSVDEQESGFSSDLPKNRNRIFRIFQRNQPKKFIEKYINDERFTKEQIEYLLQCLEEGMDLRDIERLAIPGASVEVMQRLRLIR